MTELEPSSSRTMEARKRVTVENIEASRTDRLINYDYEENHPQKKRCAIENHVAAGRNEDRIFGILRKISYLL
jgi:hypothetical protein